MIWIWTTHIKIRKFDFQIRRICGKKLKIFCKQAYVIYDFQNCASFPNPNIHTQLLFESSQKRCTHFHWTFLFLISAFRGRQNKTKHHNFAENIGFPWLCSCRTCLISFSISPARITNGPRTAYSILITFGFIESKVNVFADDAIVRWLLRSGSTDEWLGTAVEIKQLKWRWLWADRRLLLRALLLNTVFKQRLLIIFALCWLLRTLGLIRRPFLSVIYNETKR